MITLTETAAEQIKKMLKETPEAPEFLRLHVASGGCSGHEYGMGFDEKQEGDIEIESQGVKMIIDPNSLNQLKGSEIDFNDGLHGKGFDVKNPNAESTCGCGRSFN